MATWGSENVEREKINNFGHNNGSFILYFSFS